MGHDNLSPDTESQPLRLFVRNTPDSKMYISANEALSLADCFSMAAVCPEARSHAINFCRFRVKSIDVHFLGDNTSDVRHEMDDEI